MSVRASVSTWQTASAMSVTFCRARIGGSPEEAGEFHRQLARRPFWRRGYMDNRDAVGAREPHLGTQLVEPAALLDRGSLPGCGGTGDDQAPARADLALVEQRQQAALVGDLGDRGRGTTTSSA